MRGLAGIFLSGAVFLMGCAPAGQAVSQETAPETAAAQPSEPQMIAQPSETEPPETEPKSGISGEDSELLTEAQKEAICAYMDRFYEAAGALTMMPLGDLFASSAPAQLAFNEQTWEYLIGMRSMQKADLRLEDYFYDMWVLGVEELEDGSVDVDLGERSILNFVQTPETDSEYPAIWHDFVLVQEDGVWKIREHMQWDGVFWNMLKGYRDQNLEELEDAEAIFAARKELLLGQVADDLQRRETLAAEAESRDGGAEPGDAAGAADAAHPYDAAAAVAYARRYTGYRNEDWYDYSGQGGNCQNFVSQCLIAGGIPMDTEGDARWKWYSDGVNNSADELGCTMSWINVDSFYEYARDNEGYGLAAEVDADFDSGRIGDLIMMGTPDDWNHVVIITEVVKNETGETIDYLICSNTTEVKDFPASAYPLPCRALIRVFGWN